jgi:HSP20 family protein
MHRDPMDLVEEMDAMFNHIFSRMDREFMTGSPQGYGYRITIRDDGDSPAMQEMADDVAPFTRVTGELVAEVHRIGNEVKVIADLPGISEEALRLDVKGNTLVIDAGDADHAYRTSAALPPVDISSMHTTLKNGVLEVTFAGIPEQLKKA